VGRPLITGVGAAEERPIDDVSCGGDPAHVGVHQWLVFAQVKTHSEGAWARGCSRQVRCAHPWFYGGSGGCRAQTAPGLRGQSVGRCARKLAGSTRCATVESRHAVIAWAARWAHHSTWSTVGQASRRGLIHAVRAAQLVFLRKPPSRLITAFTSIDQRSRRAFRG